MEAGMDARVSASEAGRILDMSAATAEKSIHRVPCLNVHEQRLRHEQTSLEDRPREFLRSAFGSYSVEDTRSGSLIFVSPQLLPDVARKSTSQLTTSGPLHGLLTSTKMRDFDETSAHVRATWKKQRSSPFDDEIYVVLLSPKDPNDYLALGGRRLYWFDDDVFTSKHKGGLLHAIEYFDGTEDNLDEEAAVAFASTIAPAPDGREWRRSEQGAYLKAYFFRMSRQFDVVADGGDVSSLWPLPYRCKERSQLEGARVCMLLNELREFLHPNSTTQVVERAAHCEQFLHLRTVTKETLPHHQALARQHGRNWRLLDEDGQPHALFKRLDGPPPYGIQFQLGTGTTAYLMMLWYLGLGYTIASVLAIPTIYQNVRGERLVDLGIASAYYSYLGSYVASIANTRPYERSVLYQVTDVLVIVVLALSFVYVAHVTLTIEQAVDEGQATPEDYSVIIDEPPKHLGTGDTKSGVRAVKAYQSFFEELARRTSSTTRVPADTSISELVLVKTNSDYLQLRRNLKRGHRAIEAAVAREQRYLSENADVSTHGPLHAAQCARLKRASEAAIAQQNRLVERYRRNAKKHADVHVAAVFVSFNTAEMRDKVLHELRPPTILAHLVYGLRTMWPMRTWPRPFSLPPNFEYDDPLKPGSPVRTHLRVKAAREPADYIWPHLCMKKNHRSIFELAGLLISLGFVAGMTALAIHLNVRLVQPYPYYGTFTHSNQLCIDPNYLLSAPTADVIGSCGVSAATIDHLNALTLESGEGRRFGLEPTPAWNHWQRELTRLTPCVSSQTGWPSGVQQELELHSGSPFAVSNADQELFPACAFLNETLTGVDPTNHPSPMWQRAGDPGFTYPASLGPTKASNGGTSTWRVYCNYGINQTILPGQPLMMVARAYCTDAPAVANASLQSQPGPFVMAPPAGGRQRSGMRAGLSEAILQEECNDVNCLRCLSLFDACAAASRTHQVENVLLSSFGFTGAFVASTLNTIIISIFAQVLYYAQQYFSVYGIARPSSHTYAERDFMMSCLATLCFFVSFTVLYTTSGRSIGIERGWFDTLGFAVRGLPQMWSYTVMYGLIFMWACFALVPPLYNWSLRLFGRIQLWVGFVTVTQDVLNLCYEGYPFLHHYSVSYCIFVVILGTTFSTSVPLGLPAVAVSLLTRYFIDRTYLLYVYQRPSQVDGSLVALSLDMLPVGLLFKAILMLVHYEEKTPIAGLIMIVLTVVYWAVHLLRGRLNVFERLFGGLDDVHFQHKDAANYTNHQKLVTRGLISSYDPLDEVSEDLELRSGSKAGSTLSRLKQTKDQPHLAASPLPHLNSRTGGVQSRFVEDEARVTAAPLMARPRVSKLQMAKRFSLDQRADQQRSMMMRRTSAATLGTGSSDGSARGIMSIDGASGSGASARETSSAESTRAACPPSSIRWTIPIAPPPADSPQQTAGSGSVATCSKRQTSASSFAPSRQMTTRGAPPKRTITRAEQRAAVRTDMAQGEFTNTIIRLAEVEEEIGTVDDALRRALDPDGGEQSPHARSFAEPSSSVTAGSSNRATGSPEGGHIAFDNEALTVRAPSTPRTAGVRRRSSANSQRQGPFFWRNPQPLPVVTMCPNSGEAAHVVKANLWTTHWSATHGEARWGRSSRLSGAQEVHFFSTWGETKAFIESSLRVEIGAEKTTALHVAGTPGTAYKPAASGEADSFNVNPTARRMLRNSVSAISTLGSTTTKPTHIYTGLPVSLLAPSLGCEQWVLTVSRDRGEFPNLCWKILEAHSRRELHYLLQLHGLTDDVVSDQAANGRSAEAVRDDRRADGEAVWEVQAITAELSSPQHDGGVLTRWVAVLRAGGTPTKFGDVHTNIAHRVDWTVHDANHDEVVQGRLANGYHLDCVAGTSPKLNAMLHTVRPPPS